MTPELSDEQMAMIAAIEKLTPAESRPLGVMLYLLEQQRHAGVTIEVDWPAFLGVDAEAFRSTLARERQKYGDERRAEDESRLRGERTKAGIARRRAEGKPVGRQPGATDRKPRQRSGYLARFERERG